MEGIHLVGVLVSPSIDTVVRDVQTSFREPLDVSGSERSSRNGVVRSVPIKTLVTCQYFVFLIGGIDGGLTSRCSPWPSVTERESKVSESVRKVDSPRLWSFVAA